MKHKYTSPFLKHMSQWDQMFLCLHHLYLFSKVLWAASTTCTNTGKFHLDSSNNRTLSHSEIVHLKWVLAQRTQHFCTIIKHGFIFAWLSFDIYLQMAQRILFTDSEIWQDCYRHKYTNELSSVVKEPMTKASNNVFSDVSSIQHFLPLLWIFCCCSALCMMRFGRLFQQDFEELWYLKHSTIHFCSVLQIKGALPTLSP